jgi:16S rRNA (cytosine967-C5)-methyltransferase
MPRDGQRRGPPRPAQRAAPTRELNARELATFVLYRVAEDGAYASRVLDAELSRARLDPRDAALATEIVYGTLRALPAMDAAYSGHLRRAPETLDPMVRATLRTACYQLLHLGRVPPHAIVDAAVGHVVHERGRTLGGVVNAVLRKVAATRPAEPKPPTALVAPEWFSAALTASLGEARAQEFLAARALPPPIVLRTEDDAEGARDALIARFVEARPGADVQPGAVSPRAVLVRGGGDPRMLPGYAEGAFTAQEEGAQAVALAAGAQPGERIADACAGHGGKTTFFARAVGATGHVTALDLYEEKLERIGAELTRLRLPASRLDTVAVDLSVGAAGLDGRFDRVLVDAPCTGLGTVHRRPEILLRVGPDDPARLAELQAQILRHAAALVRPGGTLVYAVCSPTREEGADVVARISAELPELRAHPDAPPLSSVTPDADGLLRLGPWSDPSGRGPDVYQLFRWQKLSASST